MEQFHDQMKQQFTFSSRSRVDFEWGRTTNLLSNGTHFGSGFDIFCFGNATVIQKKKERD